MKLYIFTHIKASYNTNAAKDYVVEAFTDKPEAVRMLRKWFEKTLNKSNMNRTKKGEIKEKFKKNLLEGKFNYHFRDLTDPEEPQYFGKIHTREFKDEETVKEIKIYESNNDSNSYKKYPTDIQIKDAGILQTHNKPRKV